MNIYNLPVEILSNIFEYEETRSNFINLSMVCKHWHAPAIQLFFRDLVIKVKALDKLERILAIKNSSERDIYFQNCQHTRSLTIEKQGDQLTFSDISSPWSFRKAEQEDCINESTFTKFLSYFSNLKTLDVGSCKFFETYMQYLTNFNQAAYLNNIRCIAPSRKKIFNYSNDAIYSPHLDACFHYRHTLTEMYIYNNKQLFSLNGVTRSAFECLLQFDNLTTLVFRNLDHNNTTQIDIHKTCPNLVTLEFESNFVTSGEEFSNEIKALLKDDQVITTPYYMRNLRHLILKQTWINTEHLKYLAAFLPKEIQLTLTLQNDFFEWITSASLDSIMDIAKRQSAMRHACIETQASNQRGYATDGVSNVRITRFFQIVESFKNDLPLYCLGQFNDSAVNRHRCDVKFRDDHYLEFSYAFDLEKRWHEIMENMDRSKARFYRPLRISVPRNNGLAMINSMKFQLCLPDNQHPEQVIKYAIENCPCLHYLEIEGGHQAKYKICVCFNKSSVYDTRRDPFQKSADVLKYATLEGQLDYKSIINSLATHLPELEYIRCEGLQNVSAGFSANNIHLNIDLSPFHSLRAFSFGISTTRQDELKIHHVIVHFQYSDNEEAFYHITMTDLLNNDTMEIDDLENKGNYIKAGCMESLEPFTDILYQVVQITCHKSIEQTMVRCKQSNTVVTLFQSGEPLNY